MMLKPSTCHLALACLFILYGHQTKLANCSEENDYVGYVVLRVKPQNQQQLSALKFLMNTNSRDVEFLREPTRIRQPVDILAPPSLNASLQYHLSLYNIQSEILVENVAKKINSIKLESGSNTKAFGAQQSDNNLDRRVNEQNLEPGSYYNRYQRFATYEAKLMSLQKEFSDKVQIAQVGLSYENRPLYLIKLSASNSTDRQKPIVLIDGLHHAREWISHSTAVWILESFLRGDSMPQASTRSPVNRRTTRIPWNRYHRNRRHLYKQLEMTNLTISNETPNAEVENEVIKSLPNFEASAILQRYDIWFMPMINPDGYEFSQTSNRFWRKTMSHNRLQCRGSDPNRNYPFMWKYAGASDYQCDQTYAGKAPLSESETAALASVIDKNKSSIKMYISLHSYSQVILAPWGYKRGYPENYNELKRVAESGMTAIQRSRGTRYEFETAANLLYPAAGASDDYAYGEAHIPYAYTIELPDKGRHGFLLPAAQIIPVGRETFDGVVAMIRELPL